MKILLIVLLSCSTPYRNYSILRPSSVPLFQKGLKGWALQHRSRQEHPCWLREPKPHAWIYIDAESRSQKSGARSPVKPFRIFLAFPCLSFFRALLLRHSPEAACGLLSHAFFPRYPHSANASVAVPSSIPSSMLSIVGRR